jgi:FkbM family methyltransferase
LIKLNIYRETTLEEKIKRLRPLLLCKDVLIRCQRLVYYFFALKFRILERSLLKLSSGRRGEILSKIDISEILVNTPSEMLSPLGMFHKDGHNSILYKDSSFKGSSVLILGGYLGDSVQAFLDSSCKSKIVVMEPIHEYSDALADRFSNFPNIYILPFAAGGKFRKGLFGVSCDSTGESSFSKLTEDVQFMDISKVISNFGPFHVLEMNIEGSEYEVLRRLIETGQIGEIETMLIQFHKVDSMSEDNRADILRELNKSHSIRFNYDWVWERWDRISS